MKVSKRRKREHKTDYNKRIKLLKGGKPRVVCRKTNRYIIAQYVKSKEAQDRIELQANSKELIKYGWPEKGKGSLKSITAAYLTGYLIGKEIIKNQLENPIVDLGMYKIIPKSRLHGFLKGLVDSGLKIKTKEEDFPEEERIKGNHLKNKVDVQKIKSNIDNK